MLNTMSSEDLSPCFRESTRQSAFLNNIFTDELSFSTQTIDAHLAHHRAQLLFLPIRAASETNPKVKIKRNINESALEVLTQNLGNQN